MTVAPVADAARSRPESEAPPGRRAGRILWAFALISVLPAVVPLVSLVVRVAGATDSAWSVLFSARTAGLVGRSVLFTLAVTGSAVVIGVAAAWLTVRVDLPARRAWAVLVGLPLVVPSYVIALTYLASFGPRGLLSDALGRQLPSVAGFPGAWLALTLSTYPYVFLITRSALLRFDPALDEAARGLGASRVRTFFSITVPQLRPAIAAGALLAALYTLSDFGAVSLMRFDVFTRVIYAQYQGRLDRTPAAVLAILLIAVVLIVLWVEQRTRGRATYFPRGPRGIAPSIPTSRRAKAASLTFLAGLVTAGLGLPILTLTAWLVRGVARGDELAMRWGALTGSVAGSGVAALIAMAAAIPVAVLTIRHRRRASRWLERGVYVIFSLPHITVALAIVFFAASYLGPLYQSFAVLVVVYAVLFLAQAVGATGAALLQSNPHLEEAARGLGRTAGQVMRLVTVPLVWRGVATGGALVFLTTMKELPATLLLRPTGFDTLAVRIWSSANELFYARAAAPALLLVAVSALPMYLVMRRAGEPVVRS
ncbi:MAG TPA: iron ABC transporter permease [Acidimicrobiia bacterium]